MSSIFDLDADISSDEDEDYVPPNGVASDVSSGEEEDCCDEDLETDQKVKSRKRIENKNKEPEQEIKTGVPTDEKKRAESIWLDFLSDVSKNDPVKKSVNPEPKKISCESNDGSCKSTKFSIEGNVFKSANLSDEGNECKPAENLTSNSVSEHPKISTKSVKESEAEVFEFAGETFTVKNDEIVPHKDNTNLKETNGATSKSEESPFIPKKRGGLDSVLGSISNKKKKLSTLEKSLYDWKTFKKSEGIEEDCEKFRKSKEGFIERQRFLQRSDVRSFEVEKSARLAKRKM